MNASPMFVMNNKEKNLVSKLSALSS